MNELIELLKSQPKEVIQGIILLLMKDGVISYEDITSVYIQYLEGLRKLTNENYFALQTKVVEMWAGKKKDRTDSLKAIMKYLKDKGRINITDEQIEKHK